MAKEAKVNIYESLSLLSPADSQFKVGNGKVTVQELRSVPDESLLWCGKQYEASIPMPSIFGGTTAPSDGDHAKLKIEIVLDIMKGRKEAKENSSQKSELEKELLTLYDAKERAKIDSIVDGGLESIDSRIDELKKKMKKKK